MSSQDNSLDGIVRRILGGGAAAGGINASIDQSVQSHNQSGGITAHTVNFGPQPFEMTDAVMAGVLQQLDRSRPASLYIIGSSRAPAEKLAAYLGSHGISIAAVNSIGTWSVGGVDIPPGAVRVGDPAPSAGRVTGSVPITVDVKN